MSTRVIYIGPHVDGVEIPVPGTDRVIYAPQYEPVDVPDEIAHGLSVDEETSDDAGNVTVVERVTHGGLLEQHEMWQLAPDDTPPRGAALAAEPDDVDSAAVDD